MNVHVQRLNEGARPQLLEHFLRLSSEDLRLRFGTTFGPSAIAQYVERIDFDHDAVLGVYDDALTLIGVVHVAFSGDSAELGLSILPGHRGRAFNNARRWPGCVRSEVEPGGVGTRLRDLLGWIV